MSSSFTSRMKQILVVLLTVFVVFLSRSVVTFAQTSPTSAPVNSTGKPISKPAVGSSKSFHEDWGTISLEGSSLVAQTPVLGERDDAPELKFVRERYQMQWRPNDPLDLFVVRPKDATNPPVILYLYSFPQDTDRFKDNAWCMTVTSGGYAAVGFVSALTGHRMEHRAVKEWFVSELPEALATSAHDVQMILNYLTTRGDLDMNHVGMFGQGSGGAIAILASAADSRIKALDLLTPWGDWFNWLAKSKAVPEDERAKYLTPEFLERVVPLDPTKWLPKVQAQNLRIQDVRQDSQMPDASEEKIEASAPDIAEINQFGDPGALFPKVTGGRLLEWLKQEVSADSAPKTLAEKSERVHYYPATKKAGSPLPSRSDAEADLSQSHP